MVALFACRSSGEVKSVMSTSSSNNGNRNVWADILSWQTVVAFLLGIVLILVSSNLATDSVYRILFKETGFALLVAVFVWAFFEVVSHKKQERRLGTLIERITRNVFFGVFRRDLPSELLDETSLLVLEASVIRKNFDVTYTLIDAVYKLQDGSSVPFVRLRAITHYTLENVSRDDQDVDIGVGIPNPFIPELQAECDVNSITVRKMGTGEEEALDLGEATAKMRIAFRDPNTYMHMCIAKTWKLAPGERIRVAFDYVMAKEVEDTEVLQSRYPSDGLQLKITDHAPEKRIVGARSMHRKDLVVYSSKEEYGTYVFGLDHHLLPHQGIIIYWKNRPQPDTASNEKTHG